MFEVKLFGAITAILAAGFWFSSGIVRIPDSADMKIGGKGSVSYYMKKQSKLSAIAALFAGLSAIANAILIY